MTRLQSLLAIAVATCGMASTAAWSQQESGTDRTSRNEPPAGGQGRMVGRLTGDITQAQYNEQYLGNIVGGGDRIAQRLSGDATQAEYVNPFIRRPPGIPSFTGGREGDVVYLPGPN